MEGSAGKRCDEVHRLTPLGVSAPQEVVKKQGDAMQAVSHKPYTCCDCIGS